MEVMFHLVFEIIKIVILSAIYSGALLILLSVFAKFSPGSRVAKLLVNKRKFFGKSLPVLWLALFIYLFTYWGDHGFGDTSILPIGHHKVVNRINSESSYIEDQHGKQLTIERFLYSEDYLFAVISKDFEQNKNDLVVWDLKTSKWKFYQKQDYLIIANQNNYPLPGNFKDYDYQYNKYWNGWRFWLLP